MRPLKTLLIGGLLAFLLLAAAGSGGATPPSQPASPFTVFLPLLAMEQPRIRLAALYYDSETSGEADEAFRLWNVGGAALDLAGYGVGDGQRVVTFPSLTLAPGAGLWCTGNAVVFARSFGFSPDCEYGVDSDPQTPNLNGPALRFGNNGGQVVLFNRAGGLADVLVYEGGAAAQPGWQGPAVDPYAPSNTFPAEGQILYRKFDWRTGQPLADSDRRADWAQDPTDLYNGQRVQYPGWDLDRFARPTTISASGVLTAALGPDNLYAVVSQSLAGAQQSIRLASFTFEHVALAELLASQARRGVAVSILLEGAPAGGISDQQRYVSQLIEAAGGQVWFMVNDRNDAKDRYSNQHAKYIIVDERLLLVSSENFNPDSMPDDDKGDGTLGRRGAALVTDNPALIAHARDLFDADLDPLHHADLFRWRAEDPRYGAPPAGFIPSTASGGSGYQLVHPLPLRVAGPFAAEFVQSPETSLLPPEEGGLLGMVGRAGPGDRVLVQQLYERVSWGGAAATPETAPNPRLLAYIAAARRGATVRIVLDSFFDPGANSQTVAWLNLLAQAEQLDLAARLANPAGRGLHNKMVLVQAGGRGWTHVGSLNGSEASAKINRELALQVQSDAVTDYLATSFWQDWLLAGGSR
ncbi:MAG TPA: phospholipase D-like domain-containing protein [Anaerolineae bacterium]|nr:phospholipase D-like domain-containing protein [Anaerolineae bacterium]